MHNKHLQLWWKVCIALDLWRGGK